MDRHQLRIAHTADLHLDTPFRSLPSEVGEALREEQRLYLPRLVRACKNAKVDVLLMAGDVFDRPDVSTLWVNRLKSALETLAPVPVYIVPGNHDPYTPGSFWDHTDWPTNVHIFKSSGSLVRHDLKFVVSGIPFTSLRATTELDGAVEDRVTEAVPDEYIRIHILHGELISGTGSHSNYNPIPENDASFDQYDYVALGHVHQARELKRENTRGTIIRYSGCPQGRGFDELGEKGFWLETIEREQNFRGQWQSRHESRFVSLDTRQFLIEAIDVSGLESNRDLELHIQNELRKQEGIYGSSTLTKSCLRLVLKGRCSPDILIDLKSLADQARAFGLDYVEVEDETLPDWPLDKLRLENGFYGVLVRAYDDERGRVERSRQRDEDKQLELRKLDLALKYILEAGEKG